MKLKLTVALAAAITCGTTANAQTELYPKHFDLEQVTLLDGPMKTAMDKNIELLMQYDVDRLLTPYVRQAGLAQTTDKNSKYYQWLTNHPNFSNWGKSDFDLSGHVGGHYLTALALAYAACHDTDMRAQLKQRMDYMVEVMKDCQDQYDNDTQGLKGFIGGQPMNDAWRALYKDGNIALHGEGATAVPWYCQHKILAGLRDAYVYGGNETAKTMFLKLCDWCILVTSNLSDQQMESMLNTEHGGVNESLLDAYTLTKQAKYLTAAKRFTHKQMLNGMQSLNTTFLDGKHANTQVPKYIGMERVFEEDATATTYRSAAQNFWQDVAQNRTVCIGGNSVNEHFLSVSNSNRYIDQLDGPESCNTNNMLKFSEMLSDRTGDAKYADFYEYAMWNHILSTQDPETGGYVYFTTLRPQGYRIYSQVNSGMWCCVGTGMENHSKYGHFIYTHNGNSTLYVNLFTPSRLESDAFALTQNTSFPYEAKTELTIEKAGSYTIALRHPAWAGSGYQVKVNGTAVNSQVTKGTASYVSVNRTWKVGDKVTVELPMELKYVVCPNYTDYVAFTYGPILLGAQTTAMNEADAAATGLSYEKLQNEYAGAGRMDHAPGSMGTSKNLLSAPLLIGERSSVLNRINAVDLSKLTFTIDARREGVETYTWKTLTLKPFYSIQHARYMCYWYQQTAENFAKSDMAKTEAEAEALNARTLDFVAPGEQQSEAGHEFNYSSDSNKGSYNGESYRDAKNGGYVQFTLFNPNKVSEGLAVMLRFTTADKGRKGTLTIDGVKVADIEIPAQVKKSFNGFFNIEYPIPASLLKDASGNVKTQFVVRLSANAGTMNPGMYYLRLVKDYVSSAYIFNPSDWTTGDAARISASNIKSEGNVLKAKATGANNIALMLKYQDTDYTIEKAQTYLVVRGKGLSLSSGMSYLWWLNGSNHGTQVAPAHSQTITVDGNSQQLIAWNISSSGIYENFTGDHPSVCLGQTIFGLTSSNTDGSCEIYDINFAKSIDDYKTTTSVERLLSTKSSVNDYYTVGGVKKDANSLQHEIVVNKGKKYLK